MNYRNIELIAKEILRQSLRLLYEDITQIKNKGKSDFQTSTDVNIETFIKKQLNISFPRIGFIGEETIDSEKEKEKEYNWILDPIDGTTNFIAGRQEIAISLALLKNKEPEVGIIFLPTRKLIVSARVDTNDIIIERFSNRNHFKKEHNVKLLGLPGDLKSDTIKKMDVIISTVESEFDGFRITGALAYDLALIAINELTARISFNVKPVDIMAGLLILRKQNALITNFEGEHYQYGMKEIIISSNTSDHELLLAALKK